MSASELASSPRPVLIEPAAGVRASFLLAMGEFLSEGRTGPGDDSMLGREIRQFGGSWATPHGFERYLRHLREDADPSTPRATHLVPSTTLWWVEGDDYLGRLSIRHHLTQRLLEVGGHIGYDVRPTARRSGHATAMLAAALPHARDLGIDRALLTCDVDNVGSRRVIETNGGVFENELRGKLRFWVPTSTAGLGD